MIGTFRDVPGVGRDIDLVTTGIRIDGAPTTVATPPPRLGEHEAEVWAELGLTPADIERLKTEGAL